MFPANDLLSCLIKIQRCMIPMNYVNRRVLKPVEVCRFPAGAAMSPAIETEKDAGPGAGYFCCQKLGQAGSDDRPLRLPDSATEECVAGRIARYPKLQRAFRRWNRFGLLIQIPDRFPDAHDAT